MTDVSKLTLRPTKLSDLETLFVFQLDCQARFLAAFMGKDSTNKSAFLVKYTKLLDEPTVHMQTLMLAGVVIGSISKFEIEGDAEITYWVDKRFWGKGIATAALHQFLKMEPMRPISGRVAFDNIGSQRVLQSSGFVRIGEDKGFASARQEEIVEYIYQLS